MLASSIYWQMAGSAIVGYIISGLLPDLSAWIGTAIMAVGLYIVWRETRAREVAKPERV